MGKHELSSESSGERRTALITGASAGIGEAFARRLAALGYDLIISARRVERLEGLAAELRRDYGIAVSCTPADLSQLEEIQKLEAVIKETGNLELLINNAGFGISGHYVEQSIDRHQRMIDVHITATVRLTHAALRGMIARHRGFVINVSSIAAWVQVGAGPGYCASKVYLNSFSTNLDGAVRDQGVRIQALCPGYTYTEFHNSADYQGTERETLPKWVWMTAEEVVDESLRRLGSEKAIVIPGLKNRIAVFFLNSFISRLIMRIRPLIQGQQKNS